MRKPNTSDEALRVMAMRTVRVQFATATLDELIAMAEEVYRWLKYGPCPANEAAIIDKVHEIRKAEKVHLFVACKKVGITPQDYMAMVERQLAA